MPTLPAANATARTLNSALAPLRIVFFGPPASGKTRLLRAVATVAGKGAEEPPIDLIPADGSATSAILPLEVIVDLPGAKEETGEVHLLDCDGRAAAQLLQHPDQLTRQATRGELQEAIRDADAIVLAVDVQWRDEELRANFRQFKLFLEALEEVRTFDREAGGFPIFLTLTKCDSLYLSTDSRTQWLSRVTQRQTEVLDHFRDLFDEKIADSVALEFGSIDLEVMATATQMPSGEAFGIERLTASLLDAARVHRDRTRLTRRRLRFTVGGLFSVLAAFLATMGLLSFVGPPSALEKLTTDVEAYREREGPPAIRFAEAQIQGHFKTLNSFIESPAYPQLRPDLREYLQTREREFERYREYRDRFQPPQFSPAEVRTAGEFQKLKMELATNLAPPAEFREAWKDTEAVRLYLKWQRDLELLQSTEDQLHGWYRELIRRATQLMLVVAPNAGWRDHVTELLQEAAELPFLADAPIIGSPTVELRRGQPLTYAVAYGYERTDSARRDWEFTSQKLRGLVDLCEALGMIAAGDGRPPAVLVLPENGDSLALAGERLELLKKFYPSALDGSAKWSASHFPDPIRQELTRRLRLVAENGIRHAQRMIRKEIPEFDSLSDWAKLDVKLLSKPEFQAWGILLQKLSTWADQSQANPVDELVSFLKRQRFEWPVEKVELYLPNALRDQILTPDGSLTITVTPKDGPPRVTLFRDAKASKTDNQGTTWQFTAAPQTPAITYEPGSTFAAEIILRSGNSRFVLKWIDDRTNTFRFDRIASEPVIVRDEQPAGLPQRATGVKLTMFPEKAAIRVPVLLPALPGVK
jgi:hypothetical protein